MQQIGLRKKRLALAAGDAVIGYVRVSTPGQLEGLSLEEQGRKIEKYCNERGYNLLAVFVEPGESGAQYAARKAFLAALLYLEQPMVKGLVVNKLDRFSRDLGIGATLLQKLQKRGKMVCSVQEDMNLSDENGKVFAHMQLMFSQWERDTIVKRMWDMRMAKFGMGGWIGYKPPFGWRAYFDTNTQMPMLLPDYDEQCTLRLMHRLRKWCNWTQREIVDYLNAKTLLDPRWGPKTTKPVKKNRRTPYARPRTGQWSQSTVWKLLSLWEWKNGLYVWNAKKVDKFRGYESLCLYDPFDSSGGVVDPAGAANGSQPGARGRRGGRIA